MADNKDSRNEVHVSKKTTSNTLNVEWGISLVSPSDNMDQLMEKAKSFLADLEKPVKAG